MNKLIGSPTTITNIKLLSIIIKMRKSLCKTDTFVLNHRETIYFKYIFENYLVTTCTVNCQNRKHHFLNKLSFQS